MERHTFACLLLSIALPAHAVLDCDIGGVHVNPANGSTTAGKTGLMRCKDRDTGETQREQELRDGRFVGLIRFYERGKLAKEHSVNEQGNMHGRAREFGPDGQVLFEGQYDNAQLRGLSRRFHPNGQLRRVAFHAGGNESGASADFNPQGQLSDLRCGPQPQLAPAWDDARACGFAGAASPVDLFNDRGLLQGRATWAAGQRVRYTRLDDKGQVRLSENVDGSKRVEREFSAAGTKLKERERIVDGREVRSERLQQFSDAGTLVRDQQWSSGRPVLDAQYFLNGQPRRKTEWTWSDATATVADSEFRDNGALASRGAFTETRGQRRPMGTHQRFNAAGRLIGESSFDERGRLARERAWDDAGTLLRDDAVFEDGSRKAFAR